MRFPSLFVCALVGCNAVFGVDERVPIGGDTGVGAGVGAGSGASGAGGNGDGGDGGDAGNAGAGGPVDGVGDCDIDPGETCDDGNIDAGDGCDNTGAVEAGWFCPTVCQHCWRLSGLSVTPGVTTLEAGGNGGGAFEHPCNAGSIYVGVNAQRTTEDGQDSIGQLRGRCAPIEVDVDRLTWTAVDQVTPPEAQEPNGLLGDFDCPSGTVAAGLDARNNVTIFGYRILCSELLFDNGNIVSGAEDQTALIGYGPLDLPEERCPSGTAVTSFAGRSGALIDRIIMRCDTLTPTYCGDGQTDAPFEACDDGNVTDGDGCDSFCEME